MIEPRLLKGFRDFLPADERERLRIVNTLQETFASFGFEPIDTPILEYTEILLGKGGGETDKQVYRFNDQGGRDVAMRFDLTVPFARYMALHLHQLPLPFKRFHISKVFRGENTQRGRYREFMQCDFDTVGSDTASSDFETILMMDRSFRALGVEKVRIHFSHRGIFNSLLATLGLSKVSADILRTVDKLRKIGAEKVRKQLADVATGEQTDIILRYVAGADDNNATIAVMEELAPDAGEHVTRLRDVLAAAEAVGIADRLVVDPSITRGLDYYTGIVFETFLTDLPEIGSVCSGGRYDNLASLYTKEKLPGVGASIGLDRLMAGLEELGVADSGAHGADALLICADETQIGLYHQAADELRAAGLRIDVFPGAKKVGQQYGFAEKKRIPAAILAGPDWAQNRTLAVRTLATRSTAEGLTVTQAADAIRAAVKSAPAGNSGG